MRHHMKVFGFTIDATARMPVALLKDEDNDISMPVWLSAADAVSIATTMISREVSTARCGDSFIETLMARLDVKLTAVTLDVSAEGAICAAAVVMHQGEEISLPVPTSEAVRMSLHYEMPLEVTPEAVAAAAVAELSSDGEVGEADSQRLLYFLEQLDPSDMGKYPM